MLSPSDESVEEFTHRSRQENKLEPNWRHRIPTIWMPARDEPIRRCLKREHKRNRELQNAIEEAKKERIREEENEKLRNAENLQQINYDLEKLIEKRHALFEQKKYLLRELAMLDEDKVNNND
ncbi:unnamed protein product [Oikopleura dioica]|uniref:Uncharacterized protein n=1 Tax=Oikopleura dioica TaxID=34765 RepID=E4WVJ9_OIKDI|nr:unnamed protein product [Oikopleura dioica]